MEQIIECRYEGKHGEPYIGDAIVEYITYLDRDNDNGPHLLNREIVNIFLPEGIPNDQHNACKKQVTKDFHLTRV